MLLQLNIKLPHVLTKIQNKPKQVETSQNEPKSAETTLNDPKYENWGNLQFSASFHFSNFQCKWPNLGIFGQEISTV